MLNVTSQGGVPPIPEELFQNVADILNQGMNSPGATAFDRLACAYRAIDVFNTFVATFAVCRKGCSACCNYDVSISRLEAEYIAINKSLPFDTGRSMSVGVQSPCTFLGHDGTCTVYDVRPLNCRTFHTLDDPKYCLTPWVTHQVYGAASSGYGNAIYAQIANWLAQINNKYGIHNRDIRDWFPPR